MDISSTKICKCCGKDLPLNNFSKSNSNYVPKTNKIRITDGRRGECMKCQYELFTKPYYLSKHEEIKAKMRNNSSRLSLCKRRSVKIRTNYLIDSNMWFPEKVHPGIIIKEFLEKNNLLQCVFADECDLSPQTVSTFLLGHLNLNLVPLYRVEKALGIPEGDLLVAMAKYNTYEKSKQYKIDHESIFDLKTRIYIKKTGYKI